MKKYINEKKLKPRVFIILLNYNGWKDTIECIESLHKIKGVSYKVVVVDNKSTNESLKKLKSILTDDVILLEATENNGFSAGNNIGIKYALDNGADYVLLLNNDTLAENDFLTPMIKFADNQDDIGCLSCKIFYNSNRKKIWYDGGMFNYRTCRAVLYHFNKYTSNITGIHEAGFITGCCMLIPCKVIANIGLMDESYFLYVEDTEYSLRIQRNGYKLYWDADNYIYHKVSASTKAASPLAQYYEIRNRLLLKEQYLTKKQKITAALYDFPFYLHKVISGQYKFRILIWALIDFHNGKLFKSDRKL